MSKKWKFQSAVRIAVSLKSADLLPVNPARYVSIRRADRCLAEAETAQHALHDPDYVSIRRADRCLAEVIQALRANDGNRVSIRRADRCLAEEASMHATSAHGDMFQSAVRIAVSLKHPASSRGRAVQIRFNPPCGSLSR